MSHPCSLECWVLHVVPWKSKNVGTSHIYPSLWGVVVFPSLLSHNTKPTTHPLFQPMKIALSSLTRHELSCILARSCCTWPLGVWQEMIEKPKMEQIYGQPLSQFLNWWKRGEQSQDLIPPQSQSDCSDFQISKCSLAQKKPSNSVTSKKKCFQTISSCRISIIP